MTYLLDIKNNTETLSLTSSRKDIAFSGKLYLSGYLVDDILIKKDDTLKADTLLFSLYSLQNWYHGAQVKLAYWDNNVAHNLYSGEIVKIISKDHFHILECASSASHFMRYIL
ncbi:MAG: hypothetical protein AAF621_07910 [Pseudomonadota bacterium]